MNEQVVLVDFEYVQKLDLARLPAHARSGFEGNGPNALDFHIACHMGEGLARMPQAEFVIMARDTGFDPLLRHLNVRDLHCRREAPATAAKAAPKSVLDAHAQQDVEVLKRTEKNKRPRKRKTLTGFLITHFGTKNVERIFEHGDRLRPIGQIHQGGECDNDLPVLEFGFEPIQPTRMPSDQITTSTHRKIDSERLQIATCRSDKFLY